MAKAGIDEIDGDSFDPTNLQIPDGLPVPWHIEDTPTTKKLRSKKAKRFVLGPIPFGWWVACDAAGPHCLSVAQAILMKTGSRIARPSTFYTVAGDALGKELGLSLHQRRRAVNALEAAGLATVVRRPYAAPRVRLKVWGRETDG